jgi:hypothetical protein
MYEQLYKEQIIFCIGIDLRPETYNATGYQGITEKVKQNNKEKKCNKGIIRNPKSKNDTQQNGQMKHPLYVFCFLAMVLCVFQTHETNSKTWMTSRYSGWVSSSWRHTNPTIKCG